MNDKPNTPQKVKTQPPHKEREKIPLVQNRSFQGILLGATVLGTVFAFVERILHTFDAKAWNDLLLEALKALLKQNGPWPVILLAIIFVFVRLYHGAMMGQIKAKDDEIRRLVQQREILEEKQGVRHSSREKV